MKRKSAPQQNKAIEEAQQQAEAALNLLDSQMADSIIG